MRIGNYDITFKGIVDVSKELPKESNTLNYINPVQAQIYRFSQDIGKWRNALLQAENTYNPNRYELYRTYNEVVLDSHLTACMQQRKNLTLSKELCVLNKDGKENEELTKIINTSWFREFLNLSLDSIFWGYSLVQFDSLVDDAFKEVCLVPRQFVKQELGIVTKNPSDNVGISYLEAPYNEFCIGVGKVKDLGLLNQASPLVIWKKNALGAWAQHQEIFGSPIRIGKTSSTDKRTTDNMDNMLKNMGVAAWGRFHTSDIIELIESNKSDAYMVFDMLIERCNSEIAKLILGQTGTTAEKSFVGSAEVHERILHSYGENDEHFILDVINGQLIPMLEGLGIKFNGAKVECKEDDELTLVERSQIELKLLETYDIPTEYIEKTYGTPVIPKAIPKDNGVANVKNKLDKYYS
jgi:phage gp29-like protein